MAHPQTEGYWIPDVKPDNPARHHKAHCLSFHPSTPPLPLPYIVLIAPIDYHQTASLSLTSLLDICQRGMLYAKVFTHPMHFFKWSEMLRYMVQVLFHKGNN